MPIQVGICVGIPIPSSSLGFQTAWTGVSDTLNVDDPDTMDVSVPGTSGTSDDSSAQKSTSTFSYDADDDDDGDDEDICRELAQLN